MITKGIVEQIDRNNPYTAKVRIPVFNKAQGVVGATPTNQLYTASICCLPNCNPNIKVGDVVYVSFEDNYIDKPIILGHLYNGVSNLNTTVGLKTDSVEATVTARLPTDTNIGDTTSNDFVNLQNTRSNLQGQIDLLSQNANSLSNYVDIVTAPKPWVDGTSLINYDAYSSANFTGQPTRTGLPTKALATINLLYIEVPPKQTSDYSDAYFFDFRRNDTPVVTEDHRAFESYFNKKWTLLSANSFKNIDIKPSASQDASKMVRQIRTEFTTTNKKHPYGIYLTLNPEYYYNKAIARNNIYETINTTSVGTSDYEFYGTTSANVDYIYSAISQGGAIPTRYVIDSTNPKIVTFYFNEAQIIAPKINIHYYSNDGTTPETDQVDDSSFGFLFALSD